MQPESLRMLDIICVNTRCLWVCDHISCVVLGVMQGMWLEMVSVSILQVFLIPISADCPCITSILSVKYLKTNKTLSQTEYSASLYDPAMVLPALERKSTSTSGSASAKKLIMCVWWLEECQGICRQCRPSGLVSARIRLQVNPGLTGPVRTNITFTFMHSISSIE